MELPTDLWLSILQKTRTIRNCDKLYSALPLQTRAELKETYDSHKESINMKIGFAFQNRLSLYNSDHIETEFPLDDIMAVRSVQNWDTPAGKRNCIVSATNSGVVMFWDAMTLDYIFGVDIGTSLGDIEFHPTKSIMLTVCVELYGRKIKVWKFDENGEMTDVSFAVESLGEGKKYYYFHPFEPEIYVFASNYSYNPYHRKLSKVFFCNYGMISVSFSDRIHSFMYLNNYYTPLKINGDGTFECVKYEGGTNYFCHFVISDFEIEEIEQQAICKNTGIISSLVVWDFWRIGEDIYFYSNRAGDASIYKQTGDHSKIIYQTTNTISRMFRKNGFLVFVEKGELKFVDLETLSVDLVSLGEVPVDFCVM
jgi:hypothetical protein